VKRTGQQIPIERAGCQFGMHKPGKGEQGQATGYEPFPRRTLNECLLAQCA
jgi:hypothetical protein